MADGAHVGHCRAHRCRLVTGGLRAQRPDQRGDQRASERTVHRNGALQPARPPFATFFTTSAPVLCSSLNCVQPTHDRIFSLVQESPGAPADTVITAVAACARCDHQGPCRLGFLLLSTACSAEITRETNNRKKGHNLILFLTEALRGLGTAPYKYFKSSNTKVFARSICS